MLAGFLAPRLRLFFHQNGQSGTQKRIQFTPINNAIGKIKGGLSKHKAGTAIFKGQEKKPLEGAPDISQEKMNVLVQDVLLFHEIIAEIYQDAVNSKKTG